MPAQTKDSRTKIEMEMCKAKLAEAELQYASLVKLLKEANDHFKVAMQYAPNRERDSFKKVSAQTRDGFKGLFNALEEMTQAFQFPVIATLILIGKEKRKLGGIKDEGLN